jgi:hypothetical protein
MQGEVLGFRYATSRWLALVGLSLISFFLIFKDFPFLRTLLAKLVNGRVYRREKKMQTHNSIIQAREPTNQLTTTIFQTNNQTSSDKGSLIHKVPAICCHNFRVSKIKVKMQPITKRATN